MAMLLTTVRSCEAEKIDSFVVQTDKKRAKNRRITSEDKHVNNYIGLKR